jgi:hypothetical protein
VERQEPIVIHTDGEIECVDVYPLGAAAVALSFPAPGIVNEDATHCLRRGGEKVRVVPPLGLLVASQTQPSLVNESGGLQRMTGSFLGHHLPSQFPQLAINPRQKLALSRRIVWFHLRHKALYP